MLVPITDETPILGSIARYWPHASDTMIDNEELTFTTNSLQFKLFPDRIDEFVQTNLGGPEGPAIAKTSKRITVLVYPIIKGGWFL
jgi:hypothetical protein